MLGAVVKMQLGALPCQCARVAVPALGTPNFLRAPKVAAGNAQVVGFLPNTRANLDNSWLLIQSG